MFRRMRMGGMALALLLLVAIFGLVKPALADDNAYPKDPDKAYLSKVIVGPTGTDASGDTYTFKFAGGGTVAKDDNDKLVSDGVEQDATLLVGDRVPAIADQTLRGQKITADNSVGPDDSIRQTVVRKSLDQVFSDEIVFDHAGVYTYRVTEVSGTTNATGAYLSSSKASYLVRAYVINDNTAPGKNTRVDKVTVEREKNDGGEDNKGKVNSSIPVVDDSGKVTDPSSTTHFADGSNNRGLSADGFTFGNEYATGGQLVVKKIVGGDYGNKELEFPVVLKITDTAAKDAVGCCVTYQITGGTDMTENLNSDGRHKQLDGVYGNTDFMQVFDQEGNTQAIIKANLKHGGTITITGLFGFWEDEVNDKGNHRAEFAGGLKTGTTITVIESEHGQYLPSGYVVAGVDGVDNPTITKNASTNEYTVSVQNASKTVQGTVNTALEISDTHKTEGTTVFVVNVLEDSKVNPTGIIIDNMPYILMVAVPVAVFATMIVLKRRSGAAA